MPAARRARYKHALLYALLLACLCTGVSAAVKSTPWTEDDLRFPVPEPDEHGEFARPYLHAEGCRDDEDWMGTHCSDYRSTNYDRGSRGYVVSCKAKPPSNTDEPQAGESQAVLRSAKAARGKEPIMMRRIKSWCPEEYTCRPHITAETLCAAVRAGIDPDDEGAIIRWARREGFIVTAIRNSVRNRPRETTTRGPYHEGDFKTGPNAERDRWTFDRIARIDCVHHNMRHRRPRVKPVASVKDDGASTSQTTAQTKASTSDSWRKEPQDPAVETRVDDEGSPPFDLTFENPDFDPSTWTDEQLNDWLNFWMKGFDSDGGGQ